MKNGFAQLYKDFRMNLALNNMWYEYEINGKWHEVRAWYNGTNFKEEGLIVSALTMTEAFELAHEELKEILSR